MNTLKISSKVLFSRGYKALTVLFVLFLLVSCSTNEEKMIRMSSYDASKGEKPEFMLSGYEDYRIKLSAQDVRVENKISFEDIADLFSFDNK